jgi:hypothetical protein
MPEDPEIAVGELEAGGYLILIFLGIGLVAYVAYEVYQLGQSLPDTLSNLWDKAKSGVSSAISNTESAAAGAATYIPFTQGNANVNTPPPVPQVGVPPGYNWQTGQIDQSPSGAGGSW